MEVFIILILVTTLANVISSTSFCPEGNRNCSKQQSDPEQMKQSLNLDRKERSTKATNVKVHEKSCEKLKTICSNNPSRCDLVTNYKDNDHAVRQHIMDAIDWFKNQTMSVSPNWDNFLISQSGKHDVLKANCNNRDLSEYYDNALWGKSFLMNKKVLEKPRKNNQLPRIHFNTETVTYEFLNRRSLKVNHAKRLSKIQDRVEEVLKSIENKTCLKFEESPRKKPSLPNEYQFHILFLTNKFDNRASRYCGGPIRPIASFDDDAQSRPIGIVIIPECLSKFAPKMARVRIFRAVFSAFGQLFQPSEEQREEKLKNMDDDLKLVFEHMYFSIPIESYLFEYFSPDTNRMDIKKKYQTILDPYSDYTMKEPSKADYEALNNYFCKSCKSANGNKVASLSNEPGPTYPPFDRIDATCATTSSPFKDNKCVLVKKSEKKKYVYCDGFSGKFGNMSQKHKEMILGNNVHTQDCSIPPQDEFCELPDVTNLNDAEGIAEIGYTFGYSTDKLYYGIVSCKPEYDLVIGSACGIKSCSLGSSPEWSSDSVAGSTQCKLRKTSSTFLSTTTLSTSTSTTTTNTTRVGENNTNKTPKKPKNQTSSTESGNSDANRSRTTYQMLFVVLIVGIWTTSE